MFCRDCGTEIADDVRFCSNCGAATSEVIAETAAAVDTMTPVVTVRPVFIPWVTVASILPIQVFMTVWAGGFFGGFSLAGIKALGLGIPVWAPFVFFAALAFFGIPFLVFYAKKKTYANTEYKFYTDRVEYAEGFFTAEKKSIKLKNITEANLRVGVIQKRYGLGTIVLSTPATGLAQGRARSGIQIRDIKNAEEVYNKVLELLE